MHTKSIYTLTSPIQGQDCTLVVRRTNSTLIYCRLITGKKVISNNIHTESQWRNMMHSFPMNVSYVLFRESLSFQITQNITFTLVLLLTLNLWFTHIHSFSVSLYLFLSLFLQLSFSSPVSVCLSLKGRPGWTVWALQTQHWKVADVISSVKHERVNEFTPPPSLKCFKHSSLEWRSLRHGL